jgi:hypothetical protein
MSKMKLSAKPAFVRLKVAGDVLPLQAHDAFDGVLRGLVFDFVAAGFAADRALGCHEKSGSS